MAHSRARAASPSSAAPLLLPAAVASAGAACWYSYPGLVLVWAGIVLAGWLEPPAVFTGPKNRLTLQPAPAGPREVARAARHRWWRDVRWRLLVPTGDWFPGRPARVSWVLALAAATAALAVPVAESSWAWANAAATFAVAAQLPASRRRTAHPDDPCPGVRLTSHHRSHRAKPAAVYTAAALAGLAFTGAAAVAFAGPLGAARAAVLAVAAGTAAAALLLGAAGRSVALAGWRATVAARATWDRRWSQPSLRIDPPPRLLTHAQVGPYTVDTFEATGGTSAATFPPLTGKITPTLGPGLDVTILHSPDLDPATGQDAPGTAHPTRFRVVTSPTGARVDVTTPGTAPDHVALAAEVALARACDAAQFARGHLLDVTPITTPDSPSVVWASSWAFPGGPPWEYVRQLATDLTAQIGATALVNHRTGREAIYLGAIGTDGVTYVDGDAAATALAELGVEDEWAARWGQAQTKVAQPPTVSHSQFKELTLAPGVVVRQISFITRQGVDPSIYLGLEAQLATTMRAAPFVSITGHPAAGGRPGDRHPQAFAVAWCERPVPGSPHQLRPHPARSGGPRGAFDPQSVQAATLVLGGLVNSAFRAARLPVPEVVTARPLLAASSPKQIWAVTLRLYGGLTQELVRAATERLRLALGSPWLRVAASEHGCVLVVGATPAGAHLGDPARDLAYLTELDWEQAWVDAKVTGHAGRTPALRHVATLPKAEGVQVLDFEAPSGVDLGMVRAARAKLMTATGNAFVLAEPSPRGASFVRLLAAPENPMPSLAPIDVDHIAASSLIPFASGIDGEPVEWDPALDPHLLVVGATGSGKSACLQALIYPMLRRGWELYVADPTKGGADFTFAKPWVRCFADTIGQASAMMDALYAEVRRRVELNKAHGVGTTADLPPEIRPRHVAVILDEFTSLITLEKITKPATDDPDVLREHAEALALNAAVANIGAKAGRITREARSAGFSLILAAQRLTARTLENVPGGDTVRTNMSRILLGKSTFAERASALRAPEDAPDLGPVIPRGRGVMEAGGRPAVLIQAWYTHPIQEVLRARLDAEVRRVDLSDRLDLTPYLAREAPALEGTVIDPGDAAGPRVIDLGGLDLSLDDLDEDDPDDDPGAHAPQEPPAPDRPEPTGATQDDPFAIDVPVPTPAPVAGDAVVLLDLDGTVSPTTGAGELDWPDLRVLDIGDGEQLLVSGHMLAAIAALPARIAWLTTAGEDAERALGPLLGPAPRDVLPETGAGDLGWWKLAAADAYLAAHPGVRRVVWVDDQLNDPDGTGLTPAETAADLFATRGVHVLVVAPNPDEGLTRSDLDRIDRFLTTPASGVAEDDPFA